MSTATSAPAWLAARGGELRSGVQALTWLVVLNGSPHYRLVAVPAAGKFSCAVTRTNSGRRFAGGAIYPDSAAALAGGLENLRTSLGWE